MITRILAAYLFCGLGVSLCAEEVVLIVGGREAETGQVSVRVRHRGDLGSRPVEAVADELLDLVRKRQ